MLMRVRSAVSISRLSALAVWFLTLALTVSAQEGRIMKPLDGSWVKSDEVEIIAKAPDGRLFVDGKPVDSEQPFPDVFYVLIPIKEGQHTLKLEWEEGSTEIKFVTGDTPPVEGNPPFVSHPPVATNCAHCHGLSRRGRFRFKGGCFTCHVKDEFLNIHSHEAHVLASCGMCHAPHGSSSAKHLILSKEVACKQCHN